MKDFMDESKEKKIDFVALYEKHKRKGATTTLMSLFAMGLSGCYETIGTTGVALDGPLSGATVFYDLNGNGVLDVNEPSTTTGSDGSYKIATSATGNLTVVTTDATTDAASGAVIGAGLTFTAPNDSSIISPATTIVSELMASGLTAAEAQIEALEALGLDSTTLGTTENIDLLSFNPFVSTDDTAAAPYAAAAVQVVAIVNTVAEAAVAAGADKGDAVAKALESLTSQIVAASDKDTATVAIDLTSTSIIETVIDAVTAGDSAVETAVNLVKSDISAAVSKVNVAVSGITTSTGNADLFYLTQSVLADSAASSVTAGVSGGTLTLIGTAADATAINTIATSVIKVSGTASASISEDATPDETSGDISTTGTLAITDPDSTDTTTYQFKAETFTGAQGTLVVAADGTWTYTVPSANVSALNSMQGQVNKGAINTGLTTADSSYQSNGYEIVEKFDVTLQQIVDEGTATDVEISSGVVQTKSVAIKIVGANDAIVLDTGATALADVSIGHDSNIEANDPTPLSIATAQLFSDADTQAETIVYTISGQPSGVTIDASTGVVSGTPANSQLGAYVTTVTATDAAGTTVSAAPFTITVTNTNDAPVASSDASENTTAEDSVFTFDVSALFTDSDITNSHDSSDALTYSVSGNPSWLTLSGGTLSGTPANGDVTTSATTITITATDAYSAAATKEITLSVTNTNDAPVASVTDLGILRDTATKTIALSDLTTSDVDVGDTLVLTSVTLDTANAGAVVDNSDGTFTYTPVNGSTNVNDVTFTYVITDAAGATATSTFTIDVVDAIPIGSFTEDGAGAVLSTADYTVTAMTVDAASSGGNTAAEVAMFDSSSSTFTPAADYNGTVSFTITTSEAGDMPAIVVVSSVNDAPVTDSTSSLSVTEDTAASGTITATDVDVDSLTYTYSTPTKGAITNTDGSYTYTPTANATGSDSFTVTVSDGTDTATQTVTVDITAVDDSPVADSTSTLAVTEDVAASGTITATEVDGQSLTYTYSTPSKGTIASTDGSYTYTPTVNSFEPFSDSFAVTISDGTSTDVVQTVSVSIAGVNDAPVASVTDLGVLRDSSTKTIALSDLTTSDVDVGDTLALTSVTLDTANMGAVVDNSDGTFTYTPVDGSTNTEDVTFTYVITDTSGATATSTFTIDVVDAIPLATFTEDDAGAQLVDNTTYTVTAITVNPASSGGNTAAEVAMWNGSTFTFTPTADYNGSVAFTITTTEVGDLPGIIVVNAANDDPVITSGSSTDTSLSTAEDTAVNGTITATDVDSDTLTYSYSTPSKGAISSTDGSYTYTPTANENGSDSFTITVSDGTATATQAVSVAISAANDAPVTDSTGTLAVTEDVAATGTITATDVDGDTLTYTYSTPTKGTIVSGTDGAYTYTPSANLNGSDTFTVTVSDGTASATQDVAVSIAAVDDPEVVSATVTNSGNVYSVAFALDHTAISNADLAAVTEFALTFSGSGTATSSNGLVEQGGLSKYYAAWTSITDTRGELDSIDTVLSTGDFTDNIFTTSETWTSAYVTTIPVTSEATTWRYIVASSSTDLDITSYLSTSGPMGTLVFTLEDDVTEFDLTVTGSVSGLESDFETTQAETLASFDIEII